LGVRVAILLASLVVVVCLSLWILPFYLHRRIHTIISVYTTMYERRRRR